MLVLPEQLAIRGAGQSWVDSIQSMVLGCSPTQFFSHPSPIGNGINIHLKTSAGFPPPTGKSPNSVTQREKSFAICPLPLSSSVSYIPAMPSSAMLGKSAVGRGRQTWGDFISLLISLELSQAVQSLPASPEKNRGDIPYLLQGVRDCSERCA